MTKTVWRCEPRSHGRNKAVSPLPGRRPSVAVPHRSASPALRPCGHSVSFRRRASSFVCAVLGPASLQLAAVLGERARCVRLAVRRACACCCPVGAAVAAAACALRLSRCRACVLCEVRARTDPEQNASHNTQILACFSHQLG